MRSSEINDLENVYLRCDNLKKKSRNKHDPWNDDYAIKNLSFFFSILLPLVFINPANENAKYL